MQIHDLNTGTPAATDVLAMDTGSDTYKTTPGNVVPSYTSGDSSTATSWTSVTAVASGLSLSTLIGRITTMMKNVRFLYGLLGTTDISGIGNGTVTGALSTLNSKFISDTVPNNSNVNNVLNIGVYLLAGTSTYTNAPDTYGVLEVLAPNPSGSIKVQRLTTVNTVYIRYYSGGSWSAWRKITSVAIT